MHDAELVQVFNTTNYLLEKPTCFHFLELLLLNDIVKELTTADVLHDQKQLLGCLDDFKKLNNIGVSYHLQDVDLPRYSLHIRILYYLTFL